MRPPYSPHSTALSQPLKSAKSSPYTRSIPHHCSSSFFFLIVLPQRSFSFFFFIIFSLFLLDRTSHYSFSLFLLIILSYYSFSLFFFSFSSFQLLKAFGVSQVRGLSSLSVSIQPFLLFSTLFYLTLLYFTPLNSTLPHPALL